MYHHYFGLKEAPFSIAVNPRYLFMSARHRDALAHLLYGVGAGGGFILLTGQVGTGKTTINRCLLEQLPDNTDVALVLNPALNALELLATVCDELGLPSIDDNQSLKKLTDILHHFLLQNFSKGRNTVLLIDEAQHLQFDVLEQIRMLTNLETNTKKLLQIILVGQPELKTLLAKPELSQLAQRITARYQLKPLNLVETQAYIRHRLRVAGLPANQELFKSSIVKSIHKTSGGVPRIINVLCDRMLLGAYGQNKTTVDKHMLKQATLEVLGEEPELNTSTGWGWQKITAATATIAITALCLLTWQWFTPPNHHNPQVSTDKQHSLKPLPVAAPPMESITTTNTSKAPSPWYFNQEEAINDLMQLQHLNNKIQANVCDNTLNPTFRCEHLVAKSWQALASYNRPVVISLISHSKLQRFATLLGIKEHKALLHHNNQITAIPLESLGQLWTGEFLLIWQPPPSYQGAITEGDTSPMVKWLASQFATLDGEKRRLADQNFNARLAKRIMIFQRNNALADDGIVGLKTLLRLHEVLGLEIAFGDSSLITKTAQSNATPAIQQAKLEGIE